LGKIKILHPQKYPISHGYASVPGFNAVLAKNQIQKYCIPIACVGYHRFVTD